MNKEKLYRILGVLLLALVGLKYLDSMLIWQLGRLDFQKASGLSAEQIECIGYANREEAESRARAWENGESKDIKVLSYYNFFEPTSYVFIQNKETRPVVIPWLGEVTIGPGRTHIILSKLGKAAIESDSEKKTVDSLLMGSWFSMDFDWIKHLMFLSKPEDQKRLTYKGVGWSKYISMLYFLLPLLALVLLYFYVSHKIVYGALYFILFPLLFNPFLFWFAGAAFAAQLFRDLAFPTLQFEIPKRLYLAILIISTMIVAQYYFYMGTYTWKTFKDYKGEKILHHEWALIIFFWILPLVWAV